MCLVMILWDVCLRRLLQWYDSFIIIIFSYASFLKSSPPSAAYMRQWIGPALVQIMACHLFGAKPLSEPIEPLWTKFSEILIEIHTFFHLRRCMWKNRLRNDVHFVSGGDESIRGPKLIQLLEPTVRWKKLQIYWDNWWCKWNIYHISSCL